MSQKIEQVSRQALSGSWSMRLSWMRSNIFTILFWAFLAVLPMLIQDPYLRHLLVVGLLFGAHAMVSDITIGMMNISNFGYAGFIGLGAYTSALLVINTGISPFLGMFAALVVSSILGFFTGILTLRLRGLFVAIMAWFVALALQALAAVLVDLTRGYLGLFVPPMLSTRSILPQFYTLFALVLAIFITIRWVVNSKIGLAIRSIGQNQDYARASGVDFIRYRLIVFTLSCGFAGLLGAYYGHFVGILTPDVMGTSQTVEVIALNIIGGRGSIWGPLLVGLLSIPTFEFLKSLMEIRLIIYGTLLLVVIILYPSGLAGLIKSLYSMISKKIHGHA
jgi:branched-chain amino acid transport system permease protein